jgi:hypothetical protein
MPQLDKKALSERDICTKFITPALVAAEIAHTRTHAAHLLQAVLKAAFTPAAPPK